MFPFFGFLLAAVLLTTAKAGEERSLFGKKGEKATLVVTTCGETALAKSLRFQWFLATLRLYLSRDYDELLERVVVVWNSGEPVSGAVLRLRDIEAREGRAGKLVVVATGSKSLNNRWIKTIPYVKTEVVVNVDDDVVALKPAIECLLLHSRPGYLVGPFVRAVGPSFRYCMSEQTDTPKPGYAIVLPRVMVMRRDHLLAYAEAPRDFLRFVDYEPAHSDDILLNLLAGQTNKLRVILPKNTVIDYARLCHEHNGHKDQGLGTKKHRAFTRTAAMRTMGLHYTDAMQPLYDTATCDLSPGGENLTARAVRDGEHRQLFDTMFWRGKTTGDSIAPLCNNNNTNNLDTAQLFETTNIWTSLSRARDEAPRGHS